MTMTIQVVARSKQFLVLFITQCRTANADIHARHHTNVTSLCNAFHQYCDQNRLISKGALSCVTLVGIQCPLFWEQPVCHRCPSPRRSVALLSGNQDW